MTTPAQVVTNREFIADHGIARVQFIDDFDEARQISMGDDIGMLNRPVHFGAYFVALHTRTTRPRIRIEVWVSKPPQSTADSAGQPWEGSYDAQLDTHYRTGTLATIVGGTTDTTVTVATDRSHVRIYVCDRQRAEQTQDETDAATPDWEFWLVQLWPA